VRSRIFSHFHRHKDQTNCTQDSPLISRSRPGAPVPPGAPRSPGAPVPARRAHPPYPIYPDKNTKIELALNIWPPRTGQFFSTIGFWRRRGPFGNVRPHSPRWRGHNPGTQTGPGRLLRAAEHRIRADAARSPSGSTAKRRMRSSKRPWPRNSGSRRSSASRGPSTSDG
jgi:hypothetical protein